MPTPITKKGYDALKAELDRLRKVERAKNIEAIAEARAHGDLSENAEYDAAKERQGFIESRIAELETKLADARVVDTTGRTTETVVLAGGCFWGVQDLIRKLPGVSSTMSDEPRRSTITWTATASGSGPEFRFERRATIYFRKNLLDNALLTARETCAELLRHAPQEQLDALAAVLGNILGPGA